MRSRLMTLPPAASVMPSMRPSTWSGTPQIMRLGGSPSRFGQLWRTRSRLPPMPPEVTMMACAFSAKSPTTVRELACPRSTRARLQDVAAHAVDHAGRGGEAVDAMAEAQRDEALLLALAHARDERRDDAGPGAPGDVEARHRVAVLGGRVAAALGPADDREPAQAPGVQPGALLARGEVDVGLGPLARPEVLLAVEAGRAQPVLQRELVRCRGCACAAARANRRRTGRRTTRTPARPATAPAPDRAG